MEILMGQFHYHQKSLNDLQWWIRSIPTAIRHIDHGNSTTILTTDASHKGWGTTISHA